MNRASDDRRARGGAAQVRQRTAQNRQLIARLFRGLDDEELRTPSLCVGWTCRDVLGHLVMQVELSSPRLLTEVLRDRGRVSATFDRLARAFGARPVPELARSLDEHSDAHVVRPGAGALGPFADSCLHLRDVAIPLGLATTAPVQDWVRVLGFLTTARARTAGFVPGHRLDRLRLEADDSDWRQGTGAVVVASSEALALSIAGRAVLLDELAGPGAATLRRRVLDDSRAQ